MDGKEKVTFARLKEYILNTYVTDEDEVEQTLRDFEGVIQEHIERGYMTRTSAEIVANWQDWELKPDDDSDEVPSEIAPDNDDPLLDSPGSPADDDDTEEM